LKLPTFLALDRHESTITNSAHSKMGMVYGEGKLHSYYL